MCCTIALRMRELGMVRVVIAITSDLCCRSNTRGVCALESSSLPIKNFGANKYIHTHCHMCVCVCVCVSLCVCVCVYVCTPCTRTHKPCLKLRHTSILIAGPIPISCSGASQACAAVTAIAAVLSSLLFFFVGAISGGLGILWVTIYQRRNMKRDHQLPSDPVYEEMPSGESTAPKMMTPVSLTALESHIEMETNAAYGDSRGRIN